LIGDDVIYPWKWPLFLGAGDVTCP